MTITLTQKDADFILNYLRADLQRLNENCDDAHEKQKSMRKLYEEKPELKDSFLAKMLVESVSEMADEFDSLYKRKTDILIKCIELLTVGSVNDGA